MVRMATPTTTTASRDSKTALPGERKIGKSQQAEAAFWRLMSEASRRRFYGSVTLSLSVQDGRIQQVRLTTDQALK